jgi:hypothetical protein
LEGPLEKSKKGWFFSSPLLYSPPPTLFVFTHLDLDYKWIRISLM